ncbi:hypothetical protein V1509DRAFT_630520 [Lipomyces kononenkoae]
MLVTPMPSNMYDPFRTDRRLGRARSRLASTATDVGSTCGNVEASGSAAVAKKVSRKQTRKLPSKIHTMSANTTPVPSSVNSSAPTTSLPSPVSSPSPISSVDSLDPTLLHVRSPHQASDVSHKKVRSFFTSFASRLGPLFSLGPNSSRKSRRPVSPQKQSDPVTVKEEPMGFDENFGPMLSTRDFWLPTPDIDEHVFNGAGVKERSVTNTGVVVQPEVAIPRVVPDFNMSLMHERSSTNDSNFVPSNALPTIPDPYQVQDHGAQYLGIPHDFLRPEYSDQLLFILSQPSYTVPLVHSAVDLGDQHDLVTALQRQNQLQQRHEQLEDQVQTRPISAPDSNNGSPQHLHAHTLLRKQSLGNLRKDMIWHGKLPDRKRSHEDFALDDDQITLADARHQELRRAASAEMLMFNSARDWHPRYPASLHGLTLRASEETLIGDYPVEVSPTMPSQPVMHRGSTTSPQVTQSAPDEPLATDGDTRQAVHEHLTHLQETICDSTSSIQSQVEQLVPCVRSICNDSFAMQHAVSAHPTVDETAEWTSINTRKTYAAPITPPAKVSQPGAVFINLTEEDKEKINKAVAPSGSSKGASKLRQKSQDIIKKEKGDRQ